MWLHKIKSRRLLLMAGKTMSVCVSARACVAVLVVFVVVWPIGCALIQLQVRTRSGGTRSPKDNENLENHSVWTFWKFEKAPHESHDPGKKKFCISMCRCDELSCVSSFRAPTGRWAREVSVGRPLPPIARPRSWMHVLAAAALVPSRQRGVSFIFVVDVVLSTKQRNDLITKLRRSLHRSGEGLTTVWLGCVAGLLTKTHSCTAWSRGHKTNAGCCCCRQIFWYMTAMLKVGGGLSNFREGAAACRCNLSWPGQGSCSSSMHAAGGGSVELEHGDRDKPACAAGALRPGPGRIVHRSAVARGITENFELLHKVTRQTGAARGQASPIKPVVAGCPFTWFCPCQELAETFFPAGSSLEEGRCWNSILNPVVTFLRYFLFERRRSWQLWTRRQSRLLNPSSRRPFPMERWASCCVRGDRTPSSNYNAILHCNMDVCMPMTSFFRPHSSWFILHSPNSSSSKYMLDLMDLRPMWTLLLHLLSAMSCSP